MFAFLTPVTLGIAAAIIVAIVNVMAVDRRPAKYVIALGAAVAVLAGGWQTWEQSKSESGADSYCYLLPNSNIPPMHSKGVDWLLMHEGKYPLYEVRMTVMDLGEPMQPGQAKEIPEPTFPLGRLNPGVALPMGNGWAPSAGATAYDINVMFQARNGSWNEMIRFRPKDGGWSAAIRVERGDKVLVERGAELLEVDTNGHRRW